MLKKLYALVRVVVIVVPILSVLAYIYYEETNRSSDIIFLPKEETIEIHFSKLAYELLSQNVLDFSDYSTGLVLRDESTINFKVPLVMVNNASNSQIINSISLPKENDSEKRNLSCYLDFESLEEPIVLSAESSNEIILNMNFDLYSFFVDVVSDEDMDKNTDYNFYLNNTEEHYEIYKEVFISAYIFSFIGSSIDCDLDNSDEDYMKNWREVKGAYTNDLINQHLLKAIKDQTRRFESLYNYDFTNAIFEFMDFNNKLYKIDVEFMKSWVRF